MGLEYRNFWKLASNEELKKRHSQLKKMPKTKNSYYFPHAAFLREGEFRTSDEDILYFPHDNDMEVKFVDAENKDGPLSVRRLLERSDKMLEKYSDPLESENMHDMAELLKACGTPIPSKYTTVKVSGVGR
jgi:predicted ATP-dependent protease